MIATSKSMDPEAEALVQCPKCKHMNLPDADHCAQCQTHLYVLCRECGFKNLRVDQACAQCGEEIHRIKRKRRRGKFYLDSNTIRLIVVCSLILLVIVLWILLRFFVFKAPK